MRLGQVSKPNGPFEIVERDIPEPGARKVRIKVQACASVTVIRSRKKDYSRNPIPKGSWSRDCRRYRRNRQ